MKSALAALLALLALPGCQGDPDQMFLSFAAFTDRPVVLTAMAVNGQPMGLVPMVVQGRADTLPRHGGGGLLLGYPSGSSGQMALDMAWVDLPSGQAYRAAVTLPLSALEVSASGAVELQSIFAPSGLLIIGSDPLPESADDLRIRDVARLCATRAPEADHDYTATPTELPGLFEALETLAPDPPPAPCEP